MLDLAEKLQWEHYRKTGEIRSKYSFSPPTSQRIIIDREVKIRFINGIRTDEEVDELIQKIKSGGAGA